MDRLAKRLLFLLEYRSWLRKAQQLVRFAHSWFSFRKQLSPLTNQRFVWEIMVALTNKGDFDLFARQLLRFFCFYYVKIIAIMTKKGLREDVFRVTVFFCFIPLRLNKYFCLFLYYGSCLSLNLVIKNLRSSDLSKKYCIGV